MDPRYALRFESGERRGERIPIPDAGITVGRRPGNSLQILDNSVSGKHAELAIDAQGVSVRDLGSTNGTRIGPQRVLEHRLAHGDRVTFGNVELTFLDAQLGETAAAPPAAAEPAPPVADGMKRMSADVVARAKSRSKLWPIVAVGIVAIAAGAWWRFGRESETAATAVRAVEPVPGNLLAPSYSFEGDEDGWTPAEGSTVAFLKTSIAVPTGPLGDESPAGAFWMSCDLAPGEWAEHRSPPVAAEPGRAFTVRAKLRASAGVEMHLGLAFETASATGPGSFVAWRLDPRSGDGLETAQLSAAVPAEYDGIRVIVRARATVEGGRADFDDVSLVAGGAPQARTAPIGDGELTLLGDPLSTALLSKSGKVLACGLEFLIDDAPSSVPLPLTMGPSAHSVSLTAGPTPALPKIFGLRVESHLARARIATIGSGVDADGSDAGEGASAAANSGFEAHGLDFEREGVRDLLLGSGRDLVRLAFASPVRVRGSGHGGASCISIESAGAIGMVSLQHDFTTERTEAGNVAHAARNAERKGELGAALAQWAKLLDEHPYEDALITEAEAARGRLIQQGLEELRALRLESERARFFRLVDLFRQCRDKARAVGAKYSPSEVEAEANALAAEVERDLVGLEADLTRAERARLLAIQRALEARKASGLAAAVGAYVTERLGEER